MRSLAVLLGVMPAVLLPGAPQAAMLVLVGLLAAVFWWRSGPGAALCCAGAFALAAAAVEDVLARRVHCEERVLVHARIASVPARTDSGWRFDAEVSHPRQPARADLRVRIDFPHGGPRRPRAGETWQLLVSYAAGYGQAAEGLRDPGWALLRDRIHARARAIPSALNRLLQPAEISWLTLRERVAGRIFDRVRDPAAAALLAALAVGVSGEVSDRQWRVFNATGITHLIAISGMHVTFFALLSMWVARQLWNLLPAMQRGVRRERFAAATGVALALAYALLSGFSVPAQRTLVMLAAFVLLRECDRESRPCASLGAATIAILAWDPLAVLGAGFWLSFAAVAAIVLLPGQRIRPAGTLAAAVDVQLVVSLALLPLTLAIFGMFSFVGLAVNAVAIPVFTIALVPCVLLATLGYLLPGAAAQWAADRLMDLAAAVAGPLWSGLGFAADLPGAVWHAAPGPLAFLLATGAAVMALLPLSPLVRVAGAAMLGLGFVAIPAAPAPGSALIEVLDVGEETAVLVRTANHALLAGTAERFGSRGRRFESRVLPLLRKRLTKPPDLMLVGTLNRDRLAAVGAAQALMPPRERIGQVRGGHLPPEISGCEARRWRWDEVTLRLEPLTDGPGCVLELRAGATRAVLPFDAGAQALRMARIGSAPPPDVWLLPRRPQAFVTGGLGDRPERRVLAMASISERERDTRAWRELARQLQQAGITFISTAGDGHIAVTLEPNRPPRLRPPESRWWRWIFAFPQDARCRNA